MCLPTVLGGESSPPQQLFQLIHFQSWDQPSTAVGQARLSAILVHTHPVYEPNGVIINNTSSCPQNAHGIQTVSSSNHQLDTWFMFHSPLTIMFHHPEASMFTTSSKESTTSLMELIPEFFVLPATWFLGQTNDVRWPIISWISLIHH